MQPVAWRVPGKVNAMTGAEHRRVMIIDDDVSVRDSLQFLFEIAGYPTDVFASARDCLEAYPWCGAACMVVDQHMPDLTGLELVAEVRRRGSRLPAILVTGSPSRDLERRAAELDGMRVLPKPPMEDELLRFVASTVN